MLIRLYDANIPGDKSYPSAHGIYIGIELDRDLLSGMYSTMTTIVLVVEALSLKLRSQLRLHQGSRTNGNDIAGIDTLSQR